MAAVLAVQISLILCPFCTFYSASCLIPNLGS